MDTNELKLFDEQAHKILDDFIPDKVYDTHAHLFHEQFALNRQLKKPDGPIEDFGWERYLQDMQNVVPGRTIHANMLPTVDKCFAVNENCRNASDAFTIAQLEKDPLSVGEIVVVPGDTADQLERRLTHPRLKGFKCYYSLTGQEGNPINFPAEAFLPEGAWELAQKKGLVITLHLTKPTAMADPENIQYVRTMAKRYPHAILILAHAGRSYANWPGVEAAEYYADLDNVWFDFSAIFDSPPVFQIMKKVGVSRCMWGTDFPISNGRGGFVTIARKQKWVFKPALEALKAPANWNIGVQTLMAIRQACIMAELTPSQIEDLFYNNAARLFGVK